MLLDGKKLPLASQRGFTAIYQQKAMHLLSLKEIFEGRVFRIPDYQRGYSWEKKHLEAFWDDLENLQDGHIHYTGVITVERPTHEQCLNWQREGEAFSEQNWRQDGKFAELQ